MQKYLPNCQSSKPKNEHRFISVCVNFRNKICCMASAPPKKKKNYLIRPWPSSNVTATPARHGAKFCNEFFPQARGESSLFHPRARRSRHSSGTLLVRERAARFG